MKPYGWVYVLVDPREPWSIRYVGLTVQDLARRLRDHVRSEETGEDTHRARWVRKLLRAGVRPLIRPVQPCWTMEELVKVSRRRPASSQLQLF